MLGRVADSLFWLGRYTERAENYARFIAVNHNLALDLPPGLEEQWRPVITATGDHKKFDETYQIANRENALRFLAFDRQNPNSIISSVCQARENARQIRDSITLEVWEVLNELYHFIQESEQREVWKKDGVSCYKQIQNKLQLLWGIAYSTAARLQGWYFWNLGQYLERADKTSRILDVKYHFLLPSVDAVGTPIDFLHWNALLKSVSGYNMYRRTYGKLDPSNVVEYLVLNKYFPRSIYFCLKSAEEALHSLTYTKEGYSNKAEKLIGLLKSELEYAEVSDILEDGLHEYMDQLQIRLNKISDAIYHQYFEIKPTFAEDQRQQ